MNNSGNIVWKGQVVGVVSDITEDMWYLDANWQSIPSEESLVFEKNASALDAKLILKDLRQAIVASLIYHDSPDLIQDVLILSLDQTRIFMRRISNVPYHLTPTESGAV